MEHKTVFYDEAVRVPLIVAQPVHGPAGVTDTSHISNIGIDLMATCCDYAGIEPPAYNRGTSLRSVIEGDVSAALPLIPPRPRFTHFLLELGSPLVLWPVYARADAVGRCGRPCLSPAGAAGRGSWLRSLSDGGAGLGAMWGSETASRMLKEAGFSDVRIESLAHDVINHYYTARK